MKNGYIKLHRTLLDSKLWSCSDATFRVAVYLILSANHEPKWHRRIRIERGQTVRSLTQISDACRMSRKTVRHAIKVLLEDNFIVRDEPFGAHRGHRITLCEYGTYQDKKNKKGTLSNPLTTPLTPHKQEVKKNEKKKNIYLQTVLLTDEEYGKLLIPWGKDKKCYTIDERERAIEFLDNSIRAKGYSYKSHYAVLQGWIYEKIKNSESKSISTYEQQKKIRKELVI